MEDENKSEDDIAEEMMRMMEEESGVEAPESGDDNTEEDLEAAMRQAMEEETGTADAAEDLGDDGLEAQMLQAMMEETGAETPEAAETALQQTQAMLPDMEINAQNMSRIMDVNLSISIELGRTEVSISTLLDWSEGSLIELDKVSGETIDILINGRHFAKGEVVTVAENFGVRLVEIIPIMSRST
ncbi:MAG: FliM/FliN family flagellar motor switch protein [bacterium]|nr:FliM/FliN family flagellar motor switch protein [bacterium]